MEKKSRRDGQIAEVIIEKNRVRRPLASAAKRSKEQELKIAREALQKPTETEFIKAMRAYGLSDERLQLALQIWRQGPS